MFYRLCLRRIAIASGVKSNTVFVLLPIMRRQIFALAGAPCPFSSQIFFFWLTTWFDGEVSVPGTRCEPRRRQRSARPHPKRAGRAGKTCRRGNFAFLFRGRGELPTSSTPAPVSPVAHHSSPSRRCKTTTSKSWTRSSHSSKRCTKLTIQTSFAVKTRTAFQCIIRTSSACAPSSLTTCPCQFAARRCRWCSWSTFSSPPALKATSLSSTRGRGWSIKNFSPHTRCCVTASLCIRFGNTLRWTCRHGTPGVVKRRDDRNK